MFHLHLLSFYNSGNKRSIFDLKENKLNGLPDGMTIDADGNLWVALFSGSAVRKIVFINYITNFFLKSYKILE